MGDIGKGGTVMYDKLYATIDELYDEELEVLTEVAGALLRGQTDYGPLSLGDDPRDFVREAADEDRDWLAYRAMQIVRDRKHRRD